MSADGAALLARLHQAGVALEDHGDRLGWSAPRGVMTPELLAELRAAKPALLAALRLEAAGWLPLAPVQERLYLMERLRPGRSDLNIPAAVRATGPIDEDALRAAVNSLAARHEALRLAFAVHGERAMQRVEAAARAPFEVRDVPGESAAVAAAVEEARRPFDLGTGPTVRTLVLRIAPEDQLVVFTFHHLTCDETSLRVAMREVLTRYAALAGGRTAPLPPPRRQYPEYVRAAVAAAQGDGDDAAFWRVHLAGWQPPPPAQAGDLAYAAVIAVPAPAMASLADLARQVQTTPVAVAFTALALALAEHRDGEAVVGMPASTRSATEYDKAIGNFVNTIAVRLAPSRAPTFRAALQAAGHTLLAALLHAGVPFDRVVSELRPSTGPGDLFDAWLVLRRPAAGLAVEGLELEPVDLEFAVARHALKLDLTHGPDGAAGALLGRSPTWEPGAVDRLAALVEAILTRGGELADLPMAEFDTATKRDAGQRLDRFRALATSQAQARLRSALRRGA